MPTIVRLAMFAALAAVLTINPAFAHHPTGGATPTTFLEGLLSGFGHPVLGLDHLAALVVVGLLASRAGRGWFILPALWIAAMGLGVVAHLGSVDLPGAEFLVAGSLLVIALIGVFNPSLPLAVTGSAFAVGGFAHGHALAETVIGAEPMPLAAHLIGLVVIQAAITTGIAVAARRLFPAAADAPAFRAAAGAMGAVGLVFLVIAARSLA
ncbi:HupE/UreJ family protein [Phreatobacter sp.]|uniref:HupE/UreJ family protein n=1 Tax=Phreatobacter sp. TaxID=1966341 RepID=UPI0025FE016F|nr:HupE/UreJ family protein [Phreatobacter sp.]